MWALDRPCSGVITRSTPTYRRPAQWGCSRRVPLIEDHERAELARRPVAALTRNTTQPPQPPRLPTIHTGRASTAELRAAWQRSYWRRAGPVQQRGHKRVERRRNPRPVPPQLATAEHQRSDHVSAQLVVQRDDPDERRPRTRAGHADVSGLRRRGSRIRTGPVTPLPPGVTGEYVIAGQGRHCRHRSEGRFRGEKFEAGGVVT